MPNLSKKIYVYIFFNLPLTSQFIISRKKSIKRKKKCGTCRQEGFWEDSFPSASVNARQKSSIKFATVDQVLGIIKSTSYHRVTEIAAAVDQVFLPGHFNCHSFLYRLKTDVKKEILCSQYATILFSPTIKMSLFQQQ